MIALIVSFDHLSLRTVGCHSLPELFTNSLSVCHNSVLCNTAVHLLMSVYKQNNALISSMLVAGLVVVAFKPDPRGHQTSRNVTNLYGGTEWHRLRAKIAGTGTILLSITA